MNAKKLLKKITPTFVLGWYHYCLAFLGALIYGFPSRKLVVIGVTGTSGKSTTVDFITRILETSGEKVASVSSLRFKVGQKEWQNKLKMTMPGRFVIQKILRQAVDAGCKYAVLEVTSEGIKQSRHKFINFDAAVFLNLTPEHLDSHGGFENYRAAKLELFKVAKNVHVINEQDENAKYFLDIPAGGLSKGSVFALFSKFLAKKFPKISQLAHSANLKILSNFRSRILKISSKEALQTAPKIIMFGKNLEQLNLQLLGEFNQMNAAAAVAVATHYGISKEICKKVLESVKGMPGRLEVVSRPTDGARLASPVGEAAREPLVVVDYAFTPDQLKASYDSVKKFSGGKSLVCVLGACGGGRDKWKRSVLGGIAAEHCREIIITNEDPYDENPWEIMEQVAGGITEGKEHHLVLDRKEAIKKALELAKPEDAVIITGKGAEPLMCLENGKKIAWDDRQVVRDLLAK